MLDRYGRQVFSEFYFPWLEELEELDAAEVNSDLSSSFCRVLPFQTTAPAFSQDAKSIESAQQSSAARQNGGEG
jgi:hypothetical protein